MTHLDLFSGIGGFALAANWAGFETIGFCENDVYCQKVLKKRWPDVPIVEDIRDVEGIKEIIANSESIGGWGIQRRAGQQETFGVESNSRIQCPPAGQSRTVQPVTLVTGGFPCQSFSVAGQRRGKEDDRYLWPEMLAVIRAIEPDWVLAENVTGIIPMALDTVLSDLADTNYSTETLVIPACAVNAPHRRDRVWVVAYRNDTKTTRQRGYGRQIHRISESGRFGVSSSEDWWSVESSIRRVVDGVPNRVDRLKCLGNAIVPQIALEIIKVIGKIEETQNEL